VRFQQAARTVLIRIRAEDRLVCLRKLLYLVNERGMSIRMAEMKLTGSIDETQIYHIASPPSQREYVVNQTSSCTLFDRWKVSGTFRDPVSRSGVRILISKSFCGPFLVEIFKLISAGSIFCDNFHFSKFCAESQERC
jgi:hypothetical protein